MINFRDKNQALPTGILAFAAFVAFGTMLYMFAVPVPTVAKIVADGKKKESDMEVTIKKAHQSKLEKDKLVASLVFPGESQDAESTTLDAVTKMTIKHHVKLLGFRPQRGIDAGALTQLPFVISVSGKYIDVVGFTHDVEASGTKLAVNIMQLSASDTSTDDVTANLNVVGYLNHPLGNGAQNG
jgi:hypothetical protein